MRIGQIRSFRPALALLVLAGAGGYYTHYWWATLRFQESTDNAYVRADISILSPKISGEVTSVLIKDNQEVKKGDLLLEIDPDDYKARQANAIALVKARQAALRVNAEQQRQQLSAVVEAEASLSACRAEQRRVEDELQRVETLLHVNAATQQQWDRSRSEQVVANATVAKAVASLAATKQQSNTLIAEQQKLEAELAAAEAQRELAAIDLQSTQIRAPLSGIIGNLSARVGERVNTNSRLMSIVPPQTLHIVANFKETQIQKMHLGQTASIKVDAFPDREFIGRVDSLSPASGAEFSLLPSTNATGNFTKIVQRIPVRITLAEPDLLITGLKPGMSVNVNINTQSDRQLKEPAQAAIAYQHQTFE